MAAHFGHPEILQLLIDCGAYMGPRERYDPFPWGIEGSKNKEVRV
jgi:hypothetical protein